MKLSNNQVKYIRSLGQSKFRQKYENFVAEGDKCVVGLLQSSIELECIVATPAWLNLNEHLLKTLKAEVWTATPEQMEQVSGLVNAPDILAVAKQKWVDAKVLLNTTKPLFYLDGVQDPGNMGTIVRIADWFGFGGIIAGPGCADIYHPKVVQASMGSIVAIGAAKAERKEVLAECELSRFYILDMGGKNLNQASLPSNAVFVMGAEGKGVSPEWDDDVPVAQKISIPGVNYRWAESLNVGVAAGIIAHHATFGS